MPQPIRGVIRAATVLGLLLSACGLAQRQGAVRPLDGRSPSPSLELTSLDGKSVRLSQLRGKVVLVNFFATWCESCLQELPLFDSLLRKEQERGFEVLVVHVKEDGDALKPWAKTVHYTFSVFLDSEGQAADLFQVTQVPTSFFIDRYGILRSQRKGSFDDTTLRTALEPLLAETEPVLPPAVR